MNSRERTLALVLGGIAALFVGKWLVVDVVYGPISDRRGRLERAEIDLEDKERTLFGQKEAAESLTKWKAQSLSSDQSSGPQVLYRGYLVQLLSDAGIKPPNVTPGTPRTGRGDSFTILPFAIDVKCDLVQLGKLLYEFQRTDVLHSIKTLHVAPHVNSVTDKIDYLTAKLDVEVLAFNDAPGKAKLVPGSVKDDKKLADYKYLAEKNFFQPTKVVSKEVARDRSARDDRSVVKFHGAATSIGVDHFIFWNGSTGKFLDPPPGIGDAIDIPGMTAKILKFDVPEDEIVLQVGDKVGVVKNGQALSTWKESPRHAKLKEEPKKDAPKKDSKKPPAAVNLASQPTT
jgi:hypothetical protein